jgi:RimJ/RimL family protein N-acetyltransferase
MFKALENEVRLEPSNLSSVVLKQMMKEAQREVFFKGIDLFADFRTANQVSIIYNGSLAGFFQPRIRDGNTFAGAIYVVKAFRGKGISKKAISLWLESPKAVRPIYVVIDDNNIPSLRAFKSLGFVLTDETSDYLDEEEHLYVLE